MAVRDGRGWGILHSHDLRRAAGGSPRARAPETAVAIVLALLAAAFPTQAAPPASHSPFAIHGDLELDAAHGVVGGSGTPADPYRIEGWVIDGSYGGGIEVWDTRAHLLIRDVVIQASGGYSSSDANALAILNASNVRVENLTVKGLGTAILVWNSTSVSVVNASVESPNRTAIRAVECTDFSLRSSSLEGLKVGAVSITGCDGVSIEDNVMVAGSPPSYSSYENLLRVEGSGAVVVANNTLRPASYVNAATISKSPGTVLQGNRFEDAWWSLSVYQSPGAVVEGNALVCDGFGKAVRLSTSDGARLANNTYRSNSSCGIEVYTSAGVEVTGNSALGGAGGITLSDAFDARLADNSMGASGIDFTGDTGRIIRSLSLSAANTAAGLPVLLLRNCTSPALSSNPWAQAILDGCTAVDIQGPLSPSAPRSLTIVEVEGLQVRDLTGPADTLSVTSINSSNLSFANLTIVGQDKGLSMAGVRGLVVDNAEVRGRGAAVDLSGCDAVEIRGTLLNASSSGLKINNCRDVVLRDLRVVAAPPDGRICLGYCGPPTGGTGMDLTQVSRLDASGVRLEGWSTGLSMGYGSDVRLDRMVAVGGRAGFVIQYGSNVTLSHSQSAPIAYTDLYGRPSSSGVAIALTGTRGFSVVDNNVSGSGGAGIFVTGGTNGTISRNEMAAVGGDGIVIAQMNRGTVADNRIARSGSVGLRITASQDLTVSGNSLESDSIVLEGTTLAQFVSHHLEAGNTVNGLPVVFLNGCNDGHVGPASVGEVIAVGCDGLTIEGLALSGGDLAIEVAFSDRVRIEAARLSGQSSAGILTIESGHVEVNGSTITGAGFGIRAQGGSQLSVDFSRVNASGTGLQAEGLDQLKVASSTFDTSEKGLVVMTTGSFDAEGVEISRNGVGLSLQGVAHVRVVHSQFSLNTAQVVGPTSQNGSWDDGYPSGGNYWSNFTAGDRYGGQQQAETFGADGILDEPLRFGPVNDRYPLAAPWHEREPPLLIVEAPTKVAAGEPIRVRVFAQDQSGVAEVLLHFRFLGQAELAVITMEGQGNGVYEASIPGWNEHHWLEYYVTARDGVGNQIRQPSEGTYYAEVLGPVESAANAGLGIALLAGATVAASAAVALLAVLVRRDSRPKAAAKAATAPPKDLQGKGPDKPSG